MLWGCWYIRQMDIPLPPWFILSWISRKLSKQLLFESPFCLKYQWPILCLLQIISHFCLFAFLRQKIMHCIDCPQAISSWTTLTTVERKNHERVFSFFYFQWVFLDLASVCSHVEKVKLNIGIIKSIGSHSQKPSRQEYLSTTVSINMLQCPSHGKSA